MGCLGKGKAAAPSAFEGSGGKLCWEGLRSDGAQGEEKNPVDLQGSSSPGCCNSVGLTKDEKALNVTPAPELQGTQQLQLPRIWAKGTSGGLQQPLKLLRSKMGRGGGNRTQVQVWGNSTADTGPAGEAWPPPPPRLSPCQLTPQFSQPGLRAMPTRPLLPAAALPPRYK